MKLLKNRTFAILLTLLLVIASTLLSASAQLKNDIKKVTDGFYTGALYDGERAADVADSSGSIYKQLTLIIDNANNIYAVATSVGVDAETLKETTYYLKSDIGSMHEYIGSIHWSYSQLCDALSVIKPKLASMELSQSDRDEVNQAFLNISDAQKVISESGYNESVRRYKNSMNVFEEFVADTCGIYGPEFFA